MKKILSSQKGITLIALIITIIILVILAGIGIGTMAGTKDNINKSKNSIAMSDLTKIQQVVMETYIKYKQAGNERILRGIKINHSEAETELRNVDSTETLKIASYDGISDTDPGQFYYKLQDWHLKELGLGNITDEDEYIVNYSTGEVFDITNTTTANGEKLYIYANDLR